MSKSRRNTWIIVGVVVVVIVAAGLIYASLRSQTSSTSASYQTTTVQLGTLTSKVEGTGTVRSALTANLNWQTSGQVDKINAQIGDQVKTGESLATLLQSSLSQSILQASTNLVTAQRNLASAKDPAATQAQAQLDLVNAQVAYNTAKSNYDYLTAVSGGATTGDVQNLQAQVTLAQSKLDQAQSAYNAVSDLAVDDPKRAQAYTSLYSAQNSLATAQANLNGVEAPAGSISLQKAQASLAVAKANLATAQAGWDLVKNGPDANAIAIAQGQVDAAQALINESQIFAPFNGTITQTSVVPNQVVTSGTTAFRIDDLTNLIVDIPVVEIDVNSVKAGQPALITFDAIPGKTYNGTVLKADLSGTVGSNSVNFTVSVKLSDADALVKPGMAANVSIVTNEVTNALYIPSTAIFTDTNGQTYVYLIQNGNPVAVNVTVGAVSDTSSQITGDTLKEGDTIVLSFASTSSTTGGGGFGLGGGFGGGGVRQVVVP